MPARICIRAGSYYRVRPTNSQILLGCNESDAADIFITSIGELVETSSVKPDWHDHNAEADQVTRECEVYVGETMSPRITRKSSRLMKAMPNTQANLKSVEPESPEDNVETESDGSQRGTNQNRSRDINFQSI